MEVKISGQPLNSSGYGQAAVVADNSHGFLFKPEPLKTAR